MGHEKAESQSLPGFAAAAERAGFFLSFLLAEGILDTPGMQRAKLAMRHSGQSVDTVLLELGLIEEGKLMEALSRHLGLPIVGPAEFPADLPPGEEVPHEFLRRCNILPLAMTSETITIATGRPLEDDDVRSLGYRLGRTALVVVAQGTEIAKHLALLVRQDRDQTSVESSQGNEPGMLEGDAERLRDIASEAPIIRLLNRIIARAIELGASDIHIEPAEDTVRTRYRIDGDLVPGDPVEKGQHVGLVSRIKILARLNIAEQRFPQDGRIRIAVRGRDTDFRVSTSPTLHGEVVVLRILDRPATRLTFPALGFDHAAEFAIGRFLSMPNGIVLVTGPTGCGKTTTLYAAIELLNRPNIKIFTVEDPVEYHLKEVSQIPVRPQIGLDFATVLRSVLRQDPDVIMVGEIRDAETARIAVQAALTGHLVLTTLHTNSAAASITRLRDLGIENYLIASTVRVILAQRLVRTLCGTCRSAEGAERSETSVALSPADPARQIPYRSVGCGVCHGSGYRGRTVIHEILEFSSSVKAAVIKGLPDGEIERIATREGMTTLAQSGQSKVASGETTTEEVLRHLVESRT